MGDTDDRKTAGAVLAASAAQAVLAALAQPTFLFGADFAREPDRTIYRRLKPKPTGPTTKRAKVKAARKQRKKHHD